MSNEEFATYTADSQRANRMFIDHMENRAYYPDLHIIFRTINRRKFDAEFYGKPYISVFEN